MRMLLNLFAYLMAVTEDVFFFFQPGQEEVMKGEKNIFKECMIPAL